MTPDQGHSIGRLENVNVVDMTPLVSPGFVKEAIPNPNGELIIGSRRTIVDIMYGRDPRKLFIAGPCSVDNPETALEYAERFSEMAASYSDVLVLVMRVYPEKPRTTIGWQGYLTDPLHEGVDNPEVGLILTRELLAAVVRKGLPTATEFLDPVSAHYIADLVSLGTIGARTTESQTHRKLASGLTAPVGFKNGTSGDWRVAVNAVEAVRARHTFPGISDEGQSVTIWTRGNPNTFVVLRGGTSGPNYKRETVDEVQKTLKSKWGFENSVLVDCSHANSNKDHTRQVDVAMDVARQISDGQPGILGIMVESNLEEGSQPWTVGGAARRGVSVTDACISMETTERLMADFARTIKSAVCAK